MLSFRPWRSTPPSTAPKTSPLVSPTIRQSPLRPAFEVLTLKRVFILMMNICFFSLGLSKLCGLDFHPDRLEAPSRLPLRERWAQRFNSLGRVMRRQHRSATSGEDGKTPRVESHAQNEPPLSPTSESGEKNLGVSFDRDSEHDHHGEAAEEPAALRSRAPPRLTSGAEITRKPSRAASLSSMLESTRAIQGTLPPDVADRDMSWHPPQTGASPPLLPITTQQSCVPSLRQLDPSPAASPGRRRPLIVRFVKKVWDFQSPITLAVFVALPCALIQPVKALFVVVDGYTGSVIPNAPDGDPPLAFLLETASFIGGLTVPCTLILLGASFARLKVPTDWHTLPLSAMFAMSAAKMVLVPLVGVFLVQRLHSSTDLFPTDDKMRIFVAILSSGTPAAVNQLVVTQLYNPSGTAQTLSMFLLPQCACHIPTSGHGS